MPSAHATLWNHDLSKQGPYEIGVIEMLAWVSEKDEQCNVQILSQVSQDYESNLKLIT